MHQLRKKVQRWAADLLYDFRPQVSVRVQDLPLDEWVNVTRYVRVKRTGEDTIQIAEEILEGDRHYGTYRYDPGQRLFVTKNSFD